MPRLPPVAMSPQMRLRARFWPGVTHSATTFFQSHRSEEHTSELQSHVQLVCRLLLEKKKPTSCSIGLHCNPALILLPSFGLTRPRPRYTTISSVFFFLMIRRPPRSTLFPSTLFR